MAEINTPEITFRKKSFSKSIHRRSTKVDLTPMVDLGFLLITFFVFTTAMSTSKVMDINEPVDGPPKPVKNSAAMTILIGKNHRLFYYYGELIEGAAEKRILQTNLRQIRHLIAAKKKATDSSYLMYIIKADKNSTFGDEMNIMDEMLICDVNPGHYAEAALTTIEERVINIGE